MRGARSLGVCPRAAPPSLRVPCKGGRGAARAARVCGFLPTPAPPAHRPEDVRRAVPTPPRARLLPSQGNFSARRSRGLRGVSRGRGAEGEPGAGGEARAAAPLTRGPRAAGSPEPRSHGARPGISPARPRDPRRAQPVRPAPRPGTRRSARRRAAASAGPALGA